jgi:hypothetical protein
MDLLHRKFQILKNIIKNLKLEILITNLNNVQRWKKTNNVQLQINKFQKKNLI